MSEPPCPGDSFRGWLRRLALINGYDRADWITQQSPATIGPGEIAALARFTRVSEIAIAPLCYSPQSGDLHQFGFSRVGKRHLQLRTPKICPLCVRERPVHRMLWDLAAVQICPTHQCKLMITCPRCGWPGSWSAVDLGRCRCGFNLAEHEPARLSNPTEAVVLISESLHSGRWHSQIPMEFHHLSLGELIELMLIVARYDGLRCSRAGFLGFNHSRNDIYVAVDTGWEIIKEWPAGIHRAFHRYRAEGHTNLADAFGPFYQALLQKQTAPHWTILRNAFQQFIAENWLTALPARKGRLIDVSSQPVASLTQAARVAGYSWRDAKRSANKDAPFRRGHLTSVSVPLPDLPPRLPTAAKFSEMLGLTVSRADISGIEGALAAAITTEGQGDPGHSTPLKQAWRRCISRGIPKRRLLEALLSKQIPYSFHAHGVNLCPKALEVFFHSNGQITIGQAARLLKIRRDVVAALVRNSVLAQPLTATQLIGFQDKYVFAHHLAKSMKTNLRLLNRTLALARVFPAEAAAAKLYPREKVEQLDLPNLLNACAQKRITQDWCRYKRERRRRSCSREDPI